MKLTKTKLKEIIREELTKSKIQFNLKQLKLASQYVKSLQKNVGKGGDQDLQADVHGLKTVVDDIVKSLNGK